MMTLHRIRTELLADKKKASILGGLFAVVLILGARALITGSGGPSSARASTSSTSAPSAIDPALDPTIDAESRVRELITQWREATHASQAERDLFALSEAHFPHPSEPEPTISEGAKSADQSDDESVEEQAFAHALASITLKSTLVGKTPVAVVNIPSLTGRRDVMLRVGDTLDGFSVVEIRQGRVLLERDGTRAELTVKSPLE